MLFSGELSVGRIGHRTCFGTPKGPLTDTSSSHAEYQILAFTGGPLLPESERLRRKIITSTVVR